MVSGASSSGLGFVCPGMSYTGFSFTSLASFSFLTGPACPFADPSCPLGIGTAFGFFDFSGCAALVALDDERACIQMPRWLQSKRYLCPYPGWGGLNDAEIWLSWTVAVVLACLGRSYRAETML
jgi:hypothetical protein